MDDSPQVPMKQCTMCHQSFPATPKFFYRRKEAKDGLRAACIKCENPGRNPPKETDPEGMKRCSRCAQLLSATPEFFNRKKSTKDGLRAECKVCQRVAGKMYDDAHIEEKRQYQREHREEKIVRDRQYHAANKEEESEQHKRWYQRHKEEVRAYQKQYRKDHGDSISELSRRYRGKHLHHLREHKSAYYKTERGRRIRRAGWHRREARKKAIEGTLTPQQIQEKLKAQRYRCYYAACGHAKFEKKNGKHIYHVEHTIPISRTEAKPRHDINYVVLSCPTCNMKKGTKLPHEFPDGGRLL